MKLLLDTHVILWWLTDSPRLRGAARTSIETPENLVAISVASVWEAAIKRSLGKLQFDPARWQAVAGFLGFSELPIRGEHAWVAASLPRHHADPFDRMLIAQAIVEGFSVVTGDPIFKRYSAPTLWVP